MAFDSDTIACAQLVERGDPDRFRAVMAAPPEARRVLFPIYAANVEIARAPWVSQEPLIAEMRLQWWADALDEIAAGGIVRRHEVVTPLAHVLDAAGARCLKDAVEARRSDAHGIAVDTFETLEAYLAATGGALHWAAARALGSTDETRARRVGGAIARANWLRAVPGLLRRGARPLPDPTARGLAAAARRWRAALSDSPGADGKAGVGQRHADLAAWRVRRTLKVAARHPDRVLAGALTEPGVGERAVLAAAAAGLRGLP